MKVLAAVGVFICISFVSVGFAVGGVAGIVVLLGVLLLGVPLAAFFLEPPRWTEATTRVDERDFLARLFFTGLALRLAASMVLHVTEWWIYFGGDEATFHVNGQIFSFWLQGLLPFSLGSRLSARDEIGYPYLVGAIYYTFGMSKTLPLILNCVVGAALVYPAHALAGRWGGRTAARRTAALITYFPSLILWSALMVRDIWALFFILGALLFADHLRKEFRFRDLGGLLGCLIGLNLVRSYIFFIVTGALAAGFLLAKRSVPKALFIGGAVMVGLTLAVQGGAVSTDILASADLANIAQMRYLNALGPSINGSLGSDVDISTPGKALAYLPVGLFYFYFSPFPWQIGSPRQVMALVDLLVWYAMLPVAFSGIVWMARHRFRSVLPLIFVVIGISVLYALIEGNIGILFRHRAQIIVPLCVVAGVGYAMRQRAARKESAEIESARPLDAPARGALGPAPYPRVPVGAS